MVKTGKAFGIFCHFFNNFGIVCSPQVPRPSDVHPDFAAMWAIPRGDRPKVASSRRVEDHPRTWETYDCKEAHLNVPPVFCVAFFFTKNPIKF